VSIDNPISLQVRLRIAHWAAAQIPAIAVRLPHALGIFVELRGVKRPRKNVLQNDRMRNPDRTQVAH
jgi:hypothetical protein